MRLLETDSENMAAAALTHYRQRFGTLGLFENTVYDGIPEALASLKASGHTLFVATAKPRVFAVRIIDFFGLGPLFKAIYGSELDGTRSTKSDLIAYLLKKEAIPASETVMIGDRSYDMAGARRNGVPACGVLWGYGTRTELEGAGARCCFKEPGELSVRLG